MDTNRCIASGSTAAPQYEGRELDRRLVGEIRSGNSSALREVMQAHAGAVHSMARRVLADPGMVEEVAQDTFLELWRRPERFDSGRAGLRTYLVAMARNKAIDRLRNQDARRRAGDALIDNERFAAPARSTEHQIELKTSLTPLVHQLPRAQREAVMLAFYGGRTYKEVAQELDIPEGTAKTRLRQALAAMRDALGPADLLSSAG